MTGENQLLTGRVALVIGGSGGIGRSISLALARAGADLICHGRRESRVAEVVSAAARFGSHARGLPQEIDDPADFLPVFDHLDPVDILIVAYGPVFYGSLAETTPYEWARLISHNLTLPALLVSRFLPAMAERGYGRIVLFGGTRTEIPRGFRTLGAYATAKTGVTALMKSAALEASGTGVSVCSVLPGIVDTEYLTDEQRMRFSRLTESGVLGRSEDIATIVVQLLLDTVETVNGRSVLCESGLDSGAKCVIV